MSLDFREGVLKEYQTKRSSGSLSPNLITPTPASIRDECVLIFAGKRTRKDTNIIRLFVDDRESVEDYDRALRNADVSKFKPLRNFLIDPSINTAYKNIELLAWLIDFKANSNIPSITSIAGNALNTPTEEKLQVLSEKETREISGSASNAISVTQPKTTRFAAGTPMEKFVKYRHEIMIMIAILLTAGIGISFNESRENNSFLSFLGSGNECMYWNDDHYEELACETKPPFGQAVALDKFKLDHFKKITKPDTLTLSDINKVWYLKNNHQLELFTADGNHPEHPDRRLRPLTKYMFDKYLAGK